MDNTEQSREESLEQILDDIAKDPPQNNDQEWEDLMDTFHRCKDTNPQYCKIKDPIKAFTIELDRLSSQIEHISNDYDAQYLINKEALLQKLKTILVAAQDEQVVRVQLSQIGLLPLKSTEHIIINLENLIDNINTVIEEYQRNKPLHCKPKDAWKPRNLYGGRV